jgi:hypothetical protein
MEGDIPTLTSGGDVFNNNSISDAGRMEQTCRPAIWLRDVGATASNNTILDCPGQGIMYEGCNHTITGNDISHTCTTMNDVGAVYTGQNILDRGNVVSMNIIHDIEPVVTPRSGSPLVVGVYLDDLDCDNTIENNIFFNLDIAVLIGGGSCNTVYGNAFDSVTTPVWIDARGMSWDTAYYAAGGSYQTQLSAMTPTELTLFETTYPSFLSMINAANPALPANNVVSNSYFPTPGLSIFYLDPTYTQSLLQVINSLFNGDTIFVNPAQGNYNLVSGANVTTTLPGSAGAVGLGADANHFGILIKKSPPIP